MAWRAGRPDVDRMLDEIEPAQFDEWVAWRELEHDADERLREIIKRGFVMLAGAWSGQSIEPDALDPWAEKQERPVATGKQAVALLRQHYGG